MVILMDYGPYGTDYKESDVASSGGHVVRSWAAWGLLRRKRCRQIGGDRSSKFNSRGSEKIGID